MLQSHRGPGDYLMIDTLRTLRAKFIVQHLTSPRPLVIRAWFWLAAEADDLEEKRRCLEQVLELNPESQSARAALALLHQRETKELDSTSIANRRC